MPFAQPYYPPIVQRTPPRPVKSAPPVAAAPAPARKPERPSVRMPEPEAFGISLPLPEVTVPNPDELGVTLR